MSTWGVNCIARNESSVEGLTNECKLKRGFNIQKMERCGAGVDSQVVSRTRKKKKKRQARISVGVRSSAEKHKNGRQLQRVAIQGGGQPTGKPRNFNNKDL